MAKPSMSFTTTFDALIASLGLKEGEEAHNKCRARFFMDAMKTVNDKVASGDPTAKSFEADYATLVETRGSQNPIIKTEKISSSGQPQATEDLESKFGVLANAGSLPGQPGYKRLLRKFLTAEYATNAQEYCSHARNARDKNKVFKFEALALVCGLEYDSPAYNKVYNDFFRKKGLLLDKALKSTEHEESSTKIMAQGTNHCHGEVASSQKSDDESPTMKSLRNKLAEARLDGPVSESINQMPAPEEKFQELVLSLGLDKGSKRYKHHRHQFFKYEFSREHILQSGDDIAIEKLKRFEEICTTQGLQQGTKEFRIFKSHFDIENEDDSEISSESSFSLCGFTSADDDSQYALRFKGRGNNLHDDKPNDGVAITNQRLDRKQPKSGHDRAQKKGAEKGRAHHKDAQKKGAQQEKAQQEDAKKGRAKKAEEEFDAYFGDPHDVKNWQKLCQDLGIDPVPSSITKCKKALEKIYVNIYQFLHQVQTTETTGFLATRFPSKTALARYCNGSRERIFSRDEAKRSGALRGLLHYLH